MNLTQLIQKNKGNDVNTTYYFGISNHTIELLKYLITAQPLTYSEINRQLSCSDGAVCQNLNKLTRCGIITKTNKKFSINERGIQLYNGLKHLL